MAYWMRNIFFEDTGDVLKWPHLEFSLSAMLSLPFLGQDPPRKASQGRVAPCKVFPPSPPVLRGRGVGGEGAEHSATTNVTPAPSPRPSSPEYRGRGRWSHHCCPGQARSGSACPQMAM